MSDDGPPEKTYVTIIGKMENGSPVFEHRRGEGIDIDSKVTIIPRGDYKDRDVYTVGQLFDPSSSNGDNIWDIGERLRYPYRLDGWNVEANIVDSKSNTIVFWGILQEGYIESAFGMGGWWHFNESFWSGTSYDVKDSSGNMNHGIARNGANTIDDVVSLSANRSGMFNFVDYDDYVEVPDHCSLDLTRSITIEAWIKPFTDNAGNTIGLLDQFGYTPYITPVSGDKYLFAIVSEDTQHQGNLQTVNLTPHRQLSENSVVDVEYDFGEGKPNQQNMRPMISHIFDDVYVVAYNGLSPGKNLSVYLKTFTISQNGSIDYTGHMIFDDNESDIGVPNRPSIVRVSEFDSYSIFAITYSINVDDAFPSVGIIRTVNVSDDGIIKFTGKMAYFDDALVYESSIIHVSGDVFAVSYRNEYNQGVVKTFTISSNGTIKYTGIEYVFEDIQCYEPSIIHVSDDVFAIVYRGPNDNGLLITIKISSEGTIISTVNNLRFESSDCFNPSIMHHSGNYYIISYSIGNPSYGNYSVIEITNDGTIDLISNNVLALPFQNNQRCVNPIVVKISERGFGIVFESIAGGNGHPGYLMPIQMEYPSDLYTRGIQKMGSYGIYANPNKVFGNINTVTINASIVANSWNYVVLTYNQSQMKLYVNGILKATKPLTERIKITDSNLKFGDLFYGLIDEVAIYDNVLSSQDVYNHFKEFAPIIIYDVNSLDVAYNSAKITWETNVLSDSMIRYGSTVPPMNIVADASWLTSHSISLSGLLSKTTYYYEVESTSQDGYTIFDNNGGRYYTFTTENTEPNVPSYPNPPDRKTQIKTTVILNWIGGDEDGDEVTYDVYLGRIYPPVTMVSSNQSEEFYIPPHELIPDTTYYWQIIAWDSQGASTAGPIWSFTTKKFDTHIN